MEPISIIGAAASVGAIVELCTKSLGSLLRLQSKYKNADLTVQLLITQICTLKTALSQISEWMVGNANKIPPSVQNDLLVCLNGCTFLIETLNNRLISSESSKDKALNIRKKAGLIWQEKERAEFLTLLDHNVNALQLLLTAMQCRSQSEQISLLHRPESCQIIQLARDDTSSLLWLRDDESNETRDRRSILTENSDFLDTAFVFDHEVFTSKVYLAAMRSNMKHIVREGRSRMQVNEDNLCRNEQKPDDETLCTTVAMTKKTQQEHLNDDIILPWLDPTLRGQSPDESRANNIRRYPLAHHVRAASESDQGHSISSQHDSYDLETLRDGGKQPDQAVYRLMHMPSLLKSRISVSSGSSSKSDENLKIPCLKAEREEKLLLIGNAKNSGYVILLSMVLAYGNRRLLADQNLYSISDEGIKQLIITKSSAGKRYSYRIFDVIGLHSEENKWIYSFEEMSTMIYVADISAYNLATGDGGPLEGIQKDLSPFRQICSTKWLAKTPILLLFTNLDLMKSKLLEFPLQDYFEDYGGKAADVPAIKLFFRQKFLSLNKKYDMRIRVDTTESTATAKLGKSIVANVDKILTERSVLDFGTR